MATMTTCYKEMRQPQISDASWKRMH